MPYESVFRMPAIFVRHAGVKVYCTYKDDDKNNGPYDDTFTTDPEIGDPADGYTQKHPDDPVPIFELDDLPQWAEPPHPEYLDEAHGGRTPEKEAAWDAWHKAYPRHARRAIHAAIDSGILTQQGLKKPPKFAGVPLLPPAPPAVEG